MSNRRQILQHLDNGLFRQETKLLAGRVTQACEVKNKLFYRGHYAYADIEAKAQHEAILR